MTVMVPVVPCEVRYLVRVRLEVRALGEIARAVAKFFRGARSTLRRPRCRSQSYGRDADQMARRTNCTYILPSVKLAKTHNA
jgi:hypothetical protein